MRLLTLVKAAQTSDQPNESADKSKKWVLNIPNSIRGVCLSAFLKGQKHVQIRFRAQDLMNLLPRKDGVVQMDVKRLVFAVGPRAHGFEQRQPFPRATPCGPAEEKSSRLD